MTAGKNKIIEKLTPARRKRWGGGQNYNNSQGPPSPLCRTHYRVYLRLGIGTATSQWPFKTKVAVRLLSLPAASAEPSNLRHTQLRGLIVSSTASSIINAAKHNAELHYKLSI